MNYISILKTILDKINSKRDSAKSKNTLLGEISYQESIYSISVEKYLIYNLVYFGGKIPQKSFMIAFDKECKKIILTQSGNDSYSYDGEYIETLFLDNETMSDVEFILSHGRNPLKLDNDFINILLIVNEEGMFNV